MIPAGLIIDFDDTLVDTRRHRQSLFVDTLGRYASHIDKRRLIECWGRPFKDMATAVAPDLDYERFVEGYRCAMLAEPPIVNLGARALLSSFHSAGRPVVLVSSSIRPLVTQDLAESDLLRLIDRCWCADDLSSCKPDPRVLEEALQFFCARQVDRQGVIYVGDGISDAKVALGNRIRFMAVTTGLSSRRDFEEYGVPPNDIHSSLLAIVDAISPSNSILDESMFEQSGDAKPSLHQHPWGLTR